MGLIRAAIGAAGGTLADQWKEFFYCESISKDVLVTKGVKRISGRSSNTKGNDNIISSGSGIAVADGQCMIIVEQGKVVEVCAEPGEFTFNASTEPSIFAGGLNMTSIKNTFATIGKRFAYGGDPGKDQRVYYFNTKEILDNKFGTATPIPFRVVDAKIGLDIDVSVRCNGIFTFKIVDPLLFYTNVSGNVQNEYVKEEIADTLKSDILTYLAPAFSAISDMGIRPNQLAAQNIAIRDVLKQQLSPEWADRRGLEIVNISFNSVTIPKEDEELIKQAQRAAMLQNPNYAAATIAAAQSDAMRAAASNPNGSMGAFVGMGMAQGVGGMNAGELFKLGAAQNAASQGGAGAQGSAAATAGWTCPACGVTGNTGKFCMNCGKPKPAPAEGWTCPKCGTVNEGNFCVNCGEKRPAGAPLYKCDKCGWTPPDPKNPPKFCPECGDVFDDSDKTNG